MKLGAKRFGIVDIGPIGCCPRLRVRNGNGECFEAVNDYAKRLNLGVEAMLHKLSSEGAQAQPMKYTLSKSYDITLALIKDPVAFGNI